MMRRLTVVFGIVGLGFVLATGCGDDPVPDDTIPFLEQGMIQLARSDITGARQSCQQALYENAQDPQAAFCLAFTRLLLLPQGPWTQNILRAMGQPAMEFDQTVFGPNGMLAQEAAIRDGKAPLTISCEIDSGSDSTTTDNFTLDPEVVSAVLNTDEEPPHAVWGIDFNIVDVDVNGPGNRFELDMHAWLKGSLLDWSNGVSLYPQDLNLHGEGLGYDIRAHDHGANSGTIDLVQATTTEGGNLKITFNNVQISGWYQDRDGATCTINGTLRDVLDGRADEPWEPMEYKADGTDGSGTYVNPFRDETVVMLQDYANEVDVSFLLAQLSLLQVEIEEIENLLTISATRGGNDFAFAVPMTMAHIHHVPTIELRLAEVHLLRGLIRLVLGVTEIPFGWDFIDPDLPLADLLEAQNTCSCDWYWDGSSDVYQCDSQEEVTLSMSILANQLNQHMLVPNAAFNLTPGKVWMQLALADIKAATAMTADQSGIFDFGHSMVSPFISDIKSLAGIASDMFDGPTQLPNSPGYYVDLSTAFSSTPIITHAELAVDGDSYGRLFITKTDDHEGLCESEDIAFTNNEDWLNTLVDVVIQEWSGTPDGDGKPLLTVPKDFSYQTCTMDSDCSTDTPGDYYCGYDEHGNTDLCMVEPAPPLDEAAAENAFSSRVGDVPMLIKQDFADAIMLMDF